MIKTAILDCEIKQSPVNSARTGPGSWTDYARMGLACAVVEDNWTAPGSWRARIYQEEEIDLLVRVLEEAYTIVTYNGKSFDVPLIDHFADLALDLNHCDLLELIEQSCGRKISLDNIAQATLGVSKSAKGSHAPAMYQDGAIGKLHSYCMDDVRLTRELFLFAQRHACVLAPDGPGRRKVINIEVPGGLKIERPTQEQLASAPRHRAKENWRHEPITPAQINMLRAKTRNPDWQPMPNMTKGAASDMIEQLMEGKKP